MSTAQPVAKKPGLPILQGILPIVGSRVPIDIIAGITLAALAIPEVMGYTKIAGMPVVTGLYTILIPTAPLAARSKRGGQRGMWQFCLEVARTRKRASADNCGKMEVKMA